MEKLKNIFVETLASLHGVITPQEAESISFLNPQAHAEFWDQEFDPKEAEFSIGFFDQSGNRHGLILSQGNNPEKESEKIFNWIVSQFN